jgi:hypothetical protein
MPAAGSTPAVQNAAPAPAASTAPTATANTDAGQHTPIDPAGMHDQHSLTADMAHHFHHLWG